MIPILAVLEFKDYAAIAVIVAVFAKAASLLGSSQPDFRRLERKLDALLAREGVQDTSGLSEEVRRLAREGRKIEAIKLHREQKEMPIHRYSYKDDPASTMHTGPMAQDVEKVDRSAVKKIGGVKHIDTRKVMGSILRAA